MSLSSYRAALLRTALPLTPVYVYPRRLRDHGYHAATDVTISGLVTTVK